MKHYNKVVCFRHWACEEERVEVAKLLVDRGADIAALNKVRVTVFI